MAGNSKDRLGRKSRNSGKKQLKESTASVSIHPTANQGQIFDNPRPTSNPGLDRNESGWGYCTEDQMEELLLKNLDIWYKEAILKIVSWGYSVETVLLSILLHGHCFGSMDALSNIMSNAFAHLNASGAGQDAVTTSVVLPPNDFVDLSHLEEYSLDEMMSPLQEVRLGISRGDALWCLLIPLAPQPASSSVGPVVGAPRVVVGCVSFIQLLLLLEALILRTNWIRPWSSSIQIRRLLLLVMNNEAMNILLNLGDNESGG